jgi:hypothetical protein
MHNTERFIWAIICGVLLIIAIALAMSLAGIGLQWPVREFVWTRQSPVYWVSHTTTTGAEATQQPSPTAATNTATPAPTYAPPTATPPPTLEPTLAPEATATVPANTIVIHSCPTESLGYHPDTGAALIFKMHPYTSDPQVVCEFEAYSGSEDIQIMVATDGANIVADWLHGYQYNLDGRLVDECQEANLIAAPQCEGTWVATQTYVVPKGDLVHVYVYQNVVFAHRRFTMEGKPNFACEFAGSSFVARDGLTIVHSEDSIRVPAWATGLGTIYEFDRTLINPQHCPNSK